MTRDHTLHEQLIPFLVYRLGCQCYLELGVGQNETMRRVAAECVNGTRLIGVDRTEPRQREPGVEYFIMTTDEFFRKVDGLRPDFVFIDADHSAKQAERDFDNSWRIIRPEGLVCLHDTNPATEADTVPGLCGDVWRLARELWMCEKEAVTLPFHPGLTIVRKRCSWIPME